MYAWIVGKIIIFLLIPSEKLLIEYIIGSYSSYCIVTTNQMKLVIYVIAPFIETYFNIANDPYRRFDL